jgi:hypothetical protein
MPKNETKKAEKPTKPSPSNITQKRGRGRPKKAIIKEVIEKVNDLLEFHPITGISKENELLKAALASSPQVIEKPMLILKPDNAEKYISDILSKSGCDKNYQHTPEEQERYDELSKLPATSNKEGKNSLKKILAELLHVPLETFTNTKKFGLATQSDFVATILCLEKYLRENVPIEPLQPVTEPVVAQGQEPETILAQEPRSILEEGLVQVVAPLLGNIEETVENFEETRKVFEEEPLTKSESVDTTPIPNIETIEKNEFETQQEKLEVPVGIESSEYNKYISNTETREYNNLKESGTYDFLYPELHDPSFNIKIAKHKEFNETKYDGTIYDIEEHAKKLCNTDFELTPHQLFVKNFLSLQTPYNCLLLYHGLGTGKTCSSIGIAEEMRGYMRQVGITQPILIIASPNVQENYRLQLFDERKLKLEGGLWKLNTCIGESLLHEINPTNLIGVPKDRVITEINSIINKYYRFMGYIELANYIKRVIQLPVGSRLSASELRELKIKKIQKYFDNRLIIIDEVHNIHISEQNKEESKTATLLMDIGRYTNSMRLLLLSATPMYNSHKEIIWLTNLINIVNKQSTIRDSDVFDREGNFKEKNEKNLEGGRELLTRKLTGYVSYVRGENPYTFPYRIYPDIFSPENALQSIIDVNAYPSTQMNGREIEGTLENIPVYLTEIGQYQAKGYDFILNHMRNKSNNVVTKFGEEREMPSFENMESFGYTFLLKPLEALDIVFPNKELDNELVADESNEFEDQENEDRINQFIGKKGLSNTMRYTVQKSPYPNVYDYEYRQEILNDPNHGRIFHPDNIGKYSNKIAKICDCIRKSKGIVLIYSQYIEGSIIPLALALEEMGISRFSSTNYIKPLFKTQPTEPVDSITMKSRTQFVQDNEPGEFSAARYVMITGNKAYSPDNLQDIKYVTNTNNTNGEKVKVVIISKAGSEGLDFKCIRQVHILDPWYNMSRIEQIIGRGVRNFSHCMLEDFKERNVEIYLHCTIPRNDEEPADLYVYRYAEKKAKLIGKVNRLLKEISVDCLLNIGQHNFTIQQLSSVANNKNMKIRVSSNPELIDFQVGDRDYSDICDYDKCPTDFKCSPHGEINTNEIIKDTYNDDYAKMNHSTIVKRIRQLFKKQIFYKREQLIQEINILKPYPEDQIDFALSRFVNNKNEYIYDEYGRSGYLINKEDYYVFQPIEITDEGASVFDRSIPVDYKRSVLDIELEKPKVQQAAVIIEDEHEHVKNMYEKTIENLERAFSLIDESNMNKDEKKLTKEPDWYINLGYVKDILIDKHGIDNDTLTKHITYHFLDSISLQERLNIVRYYYSGEKEAYDSNEKYVQQYFGEKVVKVRGYNAIFLVSDKMVLEDEENKKIFIQDNDDKWIWSVAQPTDRLETLKQSVTFSTIPLSKLNRLFGFMQLLQSDYVVFKTIDQNNKSKKGSNCTIEGKKDVIKRLNLISGFVYSDKESEEVDNFINCKDVIKFGLCVVLEVLLRNYDDVRKDDKRWFLDGEKTVLSRITA